MAIEDATEDTERDRQMRNSQLKLQWKLKCQKLMEAGVLCGKRPWNMCDQKCVSLLYLNIGTEGRRLLTQKFPHDNIYALTTLKLWEMMEIAFIRPRIITFDRYAFFSRKPKKTKRMPTKPKRIVITVPPQPTTADMGDFAPSMELPLTSIQIAEPQQGRKGKLLPRQQQHYSH